MTEVWLDIRHGFRLFAAKPGFTVIAVLTLALGIGASSAIFSAVSALLVRPLPIRDVDRVVYGVALREGFDPFGTSPLEYSALRDARSFSSVALASQEFRTVLARDEPMRLQAARVTAGYFSTLGIAPVLGRILSSDDDRPNAAPVALIGFDVWQDRFGGADDVLGRELLLDDGPHTVVGVLPRGFDMPSGSALWLPMRTNLDTLPPDQRAANSYQFIARLADVATITQADVEAKEAARRLEKEYPQFRRGWSYRIIPLRQQLLGDLEGRRRTALLLLEVAVGFLLLICCANVANLLLVRGVAREREIAVRLALGAGRSRVVRQLLTESACLAAAGGAGGLLLAFWLAPVLRMLNPIQPASLGSFLGDFAVDGRTMLFAVGVSLATGLAFGSAPAFTATRIGNMMSALKRRGHGGDTPRSRRLLGALVIVELAIAVTLLVNGSLIVQSFTRLQRVDLGFDPAQLLVVQLTSPLQRYETHAERVAFVDRIAGAVRAIPGVGAVGVTTNVPLEALSFDAVYAVEGRGPVNTSEVPITAHRLVTPQYLQTLGVRLQRGRFLNEQDHAGSPPVVVITSTLARQEWPGQDPIGKRLRRVRRQQTDLPWMTVVGVVDDVKEDRFNFRNDRAAWYVPYAQDSSVAAPLSLVIRSSANPEAVAAEVRRAIRSIDGRQPVSRMVTMPQHLSDILVTERFSAALMTALAALGLFLAACGLYGVISYSVSQRTSELGLRLALGANRASVVRLVLGRAILLVGVGLAAGTLLARVSGMFLAGTLYEIAPGDPATFAIVAIALAAVSALACSVPALRATRIDPLVALRTE